MFWVFGFRYNVNWFGLVWFTTTSYEAGMLFIILINSASKPLEQKNVFACQLRFSFVINYSFPHLRITQHIFIFLSNTILNNNANEFSNKRCCYVGKISAHKN